LLYTVSVLKGKKKKMSTDLKDLRLKFMSQHMAMSANNSNGSTVATAKKQQKKKVLIL